MVQGDGNITFFGSVSDSAIVMGPQNKVRVTGGSRPKKQKPK
jgi:hypothetical protein